jgi:polar amino acid transport system substrate-binding protein
MVTPSAAAALLAPTGSLRVGVWMVPYFAVEGTGALAGVIPDLGRELARRLGVPCDLVPIKNPAAMIAAFRSGSVDATFIGITADRAAAIDFGPTVLGIQTTFLVPASSPIDAIGEVDRPGVRIAVPQNSAQAAHLAKIMTRARLIPVQAENPAQAIALLGSGDADAFSHVAPMLALVQGALPASRLLPGSYFDVPIALGSAKGVPRAAAAFCEAFAADVEASGFVAQAIARMGANARGLVTAGRMA